MAIRSYLKTRGTSWGELKENKSIGSIMDDWGGVDYMKDEIKKGRSMEDVANDIGLSSQSLRKYLKKKRHLLDRIDQKCPYCQKWFYC